VRVQFPRSRIILLRIRPFQQEEIERDQCRPFEPECLAPVLHSEGKIGTGPIEHRHEIIRDVLHAACRKIPDGAFVSFDIPFEPFALCFDRFVNGNAFHHAPLHSGPPDVDDPFIDLLDGPDLAVRDMVERGDDPRASGLTDIPCRLTGSFGPNQRMVCCRRYVQWM
jgi:hypothetical protein